eukprot:gene14823-biopygen31735
MELVPALGRSRLRPAATAPSFPPRVELTSQQVGVLPKGPSPGSALVPLPSDPARDPNSDGSPPGAAVRTSPAPLGSVASRPQMPPSLRRCPLELPRGPSSPKRPRLDQGVGLAPGRPATAAVERLQLDYGVSPDQAQQLLDGGGPPPPSIPGSYGVTVFTSRLPTPVNTRRVLPSPKWYDPRKWERAGLHKFSLGPRRAVLACAPLESYPSFWGPFGTGCTPVFESTLRALLGGFRPPSHGSYPERCLTACRSWRCPTAFVKAYQANWNSNREVGRRMPLGKVLDLIQRGWFQAGPDLPNAVELPSSWRSGVQAWREDFVVGTVLGPYPRSTNLRACLRTWASMDAPEHVVQSIVHGYSPRYFAECMPAWFQNAVNTAEHHAFVTDSIRAMAQAAHVVPWDWRRWGIPSVVIPLSVAVASSGKRRLIWDCRYPNLSELLRAFTLPSVLSFGLRLPAGRIRLGKWDLKSGYHHLELSARTRGLLAVVWKGEVWAARALPFGMGSAVDCFQELTLVPANVVALDTVVEQYIDDTVALHSEEGYPAIDRVLNEVGYDGPRLHPIADLLMASGFALGVAKCVFDPVPALVFLGTMIDTLARRFRVAAERLARLVVGWQSLQWLGECVAERLASFAGLVASVAVPVPEALVVSRLLNSAIHRAGCDEPFEIWDKLVPFPAEIRRRVDRFMRAIPSLEGAPLDSTPPDVLLATGASDQAAGGVVRVLHSAQPSSHPFRYVFRGAERDLNINAKEAIGVRQGLAALRGLRLHGSLPASRELRVFIR